MDIAWGLQHVAHLLKPWMMICLMYILIVERSAARVQLGLHLLPSIEPPIDG